MTKKSNYYKVGLDPEVRLRSQLIFGVLTILFSISFGWGIYAGVKSGKFNQVLIEPTKNFFKELATVTEPSDVSLDLLESTPSGTVNINIQNNTQGSPTKTQSKTTQPQVTPYQVPTYTTNDKSFEQRVAEQNAAADKAYQEAIKKQKEWAAQQRAAGQTWLQEQSAKDEAASKAWYDAAVQQSQQNLEEWKKAHGF